MSKLQTLCPGVKPISRRCIFIFLFDFRSAYGHHRGYLAEAKPVTMAQAVLKLLPTLPDSVLQEALASVGSLTPQRAEAGLVEESHA